MSDAEAGARAGTGDVSFDRAQPWDAELVSLRNVLIALSVVFWAGVMLYTRFYPMPRAQFGVAFLGGILILYIVTELMALSDGDGNGHLLADLKSAYGPGNRVDAALLSLSAIDVIATTVYMSVNFQALYVERAGRALPHEYVMAAVFSVVMVYLTWRSFGGTFVAVVLLGFGYGYFGMYAPGPLQHGGLGVERILRTVVVSIDGFFGFLTQLVAAWIALFLLYAGFLKAYGAFDLIMRLAFRSAKYIDSGIAQTAVLSSAVIGSVNGSQTANAGMTGSFTIPLMKRNGVKPETAGAIEAVASTAGQVLPPVMGAGAFIMASLITGVTYVDVIIAGIIPAVILSLTIFVAVHYVAAPQLDDTDPSTLLNDKMPRSEFASESLKYGIPLAVLIYKLGVEQVTVGTAALWTTGAMLLTGMLFPVIHSAVGDADETVVESLKRTSWETLDGAREGVVVLAPVTIILAAINGVVDILTATGVPTAISLTLLDLSGGVLLIAAILSMIICIILGLGMPTTASYTIVALLVAPTLISQFFLPEFAGHFFVFYAAILAGLTPPIATCVAVACGIAGANFWRSCWEAIKLSAPLFILPFTFVYHPEVVSAEFNQLSLTSGGFALFGAIAMIHGINYRFVFGDVVTITSRISFFVAGVLAMVYPSRVVQTAAVLLVIAMYVLQSFAGRPDPVGVLTRTLGLSSGGGVPGTEQPERE
ncbi:TRAP transporter permease [Halobaculum magnesiiphilum]|uniref:TRAP transporter fused permease subunit n=1 Tax=Halobaculum magnesiiphilum TaxID=1017351 RepID=A0A8T8WHX0_9EURY|nr:TRAP transporter fused permease subunit [Halobaculum magnesiiphilum]QZP39449.1 TRAP transporter fused permease subunit [Halobaculum magnesiiphilum]